MLARSFAISAATLAMLTSTAIATPVYAADPDTNSTIVHYGDLDLTGTDGEVALKQRIARAAKNVCWNVDGPTLQEHARFDACRDNAIAGASPKMNAVIASARSDHRFAMNTDAIAMSGR
jgi:UrcA family protein